MPSKRPSRPAKIASTKPAAPVLGSTTASTDPARSKWDPRNLKKEHIMMAAPLLAAGQALFKGPIESAKKGVNDIMQHRVDDAVSGIDDKLSGRHGRRHHRRYSDSSSESASESKSSKPPKPGPRKRPEQSQYRVESAKVINIQLNLNVYPATLAGFMIELDIGCPVQPDWPIRRVRVNHNNIYVANPHLFTLITFKTLREYHYIGQSSLFTMADECPFELPLARGGLVYLEDPYQPNCFRDANEVMSPYGLSVPYNPVSRFQLVVLPDGLNSGAIARDAELARNYFQQHQEDFSRLSRDMLRQDPRLNIGPLASTNPDRQITLNHYFRKWDHCIQRSVVMNIWEPGYTPLEPVRDALFQPQLCPQDNRRRSSSSSEAARPRGRHSRRHSSSSESSKSAASEKRKNESPNFMPMLLPIMGTLGGKKPAPPPQGPPEQGPVTRKPLLTYNEGPGAHYSNGPPPVSRQGRYASTRASTPGRTRTSRRRRQYA